MFSYGNGHRNRPDYRRAGVLFSDGASDCSVGRRPGPARASCPGLVTEGTLLGLGGLSSLAVLVSVFALGTVSGCAPAVTARGLPRVSRYAGPAQLDWMLGRYQALSQAEGELREEACLGWERAVFDLDSGRRYPVLLRMSLDAIALENLWQDLPTLAQRHPRPPACAELAPDGGPESASRKPAAEQSAGPPAGAPTAADAPGADPGAPPSATPLGSPQDSPVAPGGGTGVAAASGPGAPVSASAPPAVPRPEAAPPESRFAKQRRQLFRLRTALGMQLAPSPRGGSGLTGAASGREEPRPLLQADLRPELKYEIGDDALAVLNELAQSDLPPIRLRARFHLLGLCTLAVEAADRYLNEPPTLTESSLNLQKACGRRSPRETLRQGQSRLLWAMLAAWRVRYPADPLEPLGDLVIALASFAARDNPVVDGPRGVR